MQSVVESVLSPGNKHIEPPERVVIIGANTGGPQALAQLLPQFPPGFPGAIVVIQQMRPGFTRVLGDQLGSLCQIPAYEPTDGQGLQKSTILIVPSGVSFQLSEAAGSPVGGYEIRLDDVRSDPDRYPNRINEAMISAAKTFGCGAVGVLLTGLGEDGVEGMRAISAAGGLTVAQDAASSIVHDMALRSIDAGVVNDVLPLWSIADRIKNAAIGEANANAA